MNFIKHCNVQKRKKYTMSCKSKTHGVSNALIKSHSRGQDY